MAPSASLDPDIYIADEVAKVTVEKDRHLLRPTPPVLGCSVFRLAGTGGIA